MEKELFVSGYCRSIDNSRMVAAVTEAGTLLEVDCCYETCPHTPNCTIAARIQEELKNV